MYKYKLILSYDGTNYSGWQIQPNAPSIQEKLEKTFEILLKQPLRVIGAGRTDAGVHALNQTAHFTHSERLDERQVLFSLNGLLPSDIRVKSIELASDDFHAQYSAISKIYRYHLWTERIIDPFHHLYRYHFYFPYSKEQLEQAAKKFIGTKDFAAFANVGGSVKTSVRNLKRIDIFEEIGGICLEFEGNGFLYKMVRNIVGHMLDVSRKKRDLEEIEEIFKKKDRRYAAMAAPAKGLFLAKVIY